MCGCGQWEDVYSVERHSVHQDRPDAGGCSHDLRVTWLGFVKMCIKCASTEMEDGTMLLTTKDGGPPRVVRPDVAQSNGGFLKESSEPSAVVSLGKRPMASIEAYLCESCNVMRAKKTYVPPGLERKRCYCTKCYEWKIGK